MPNQTDSTTTHVSRRSLLKSVPVVAGGLMSMTATAQNALAQAKVSHTDSKYQDSPKNGQKCSTCVQFQPPASCKIVADPISPDGWCQFYAAK
jgi:High potential iron-sulfur protein